MDGIAERLKLNPPVKRYKIGEAAEYTGLSRQTVHNYTVMGLIRESQWTDGGHRLYGESVFESLLRVEELKHTNSLREIRRLFDQERVDGQMELDSSSHAAV